MNLAESKEAMEVLFEIQKDVKKEADKLMGGDYNKVVAKEMQKSYMKMLTRAI